MVHVSRRAVAVSAEVAALLLAGVMALPALRRRLHESFGQAREESTQGHSSLAGLEVPDPTGSTSGLAADGYVDHEAADDHPGQVERGGVPAPVGHGEAADQGTDSRPGHVPRGGANDGMAPERSPDASRGTNAKAFVRRCLTTSWAYTCRGPDVRKLLRAGC
jgi:hypothetical protein